MQASRHQYRYPGSHPFQDTSIDRKLFFGREEEGDLLFHKILTSKLVVLYGKSGLGKTSLVNAGLMKQLRKKEFIPIAMRLNDPRSGPRQAIYEGIQKTTAAHHVDHTPGDTTSLWQYFKTAEFWSENDILLTPILVLDQFEELFTLHAPDTRKKFIAQLADLVNDRMPEELDPDKFHTYSETALNVKVVICIRERDLGSVDEMVRDIPAILKNRFRLSPLTRQQAKKAILNPAKLELEEITTKSFTYTEDAVSGMLDFLSRQSTPNVERNSADEIEPFQLQLLCHNFEKKVQEKERDDLKGLAVTRKDLGGDTGMQKILQDFYDNLTNQLGSGRDKKRVRKLCEKVLIQSGRRVSMDSGVIESQYNVPKSLLDELVDERLLRSDTRPTGVHYELSHDTLVKPILKSREKRKARSLKKRIPIAVVIAMPIILVVGGITIHYLDSLKIQNLKSTGNVYLLEGQHEKAMKEYKNAIDINPKHKKNEESYISLGNTQAQINLYPEAIKSYKEALNINPRNIDAYIGLGSVYEEKRDLDEAIKNYKEAIALDNKNARAYIGLATIYFQLRNFDNAINNYNKAIDIDSQNADAYLGLASIYFWQDNLDKAINNYKKAIDIDNRNANAYIGLATIYSRQNHFEMAIINYERGVAYGGPNSNAHVGLASVYSRLSKTEEAINNYRKAIQLDDQNTDAYVGLAFINFQQGNVDEAMTNYNKAIEIDGNNANSYIGLGSVYKEKGDLDQAIKNYSKAIDIDDNNPNAYIGLGSVYTEDEQFDAAIETYKIAESRDNKNPQVYVGLGYAYLKQNNFEEARKNYQRALDLDPRLEYLEGLILELRLVQR